MDITPVALLCHSQKLGLSTPLMGLFLYAKASQTENMI